MTKGVRWLARVLGLDGDSRDDDGIASFEHIDGSRLAAGEFHLSDSMRLDDVNFPDFAETLPACSLRVHALPSRVAAGQRSF